MNPSPPARKLCQPCKYYIRCSENIWIFRYLNIPIFKYLDFWIFWYLNIWIPLLQLVNRVNHASIISAALKISPESEIQKCKVLYPLLFKYHWNLKFKKFKSKEIKREIRTSRTRSMAKSSTQTVHILW